MTARVLVVDDSAVVRKVVGELVASAPGLTLVGTAPNGKLALLRIDELRPDLVVLDIEMPEMDGLDVLRQLRASGRSLPVLVFSTVTERAGERTLDALALGASDYVTKPSRSLGELGSVEHLRVDLLAKIHALVAKSPPAARDEPPTHQAPLASPASRPRPSIVALGASTGGPNALATVLSSLPSDFSVPLVIVQHMPPVFTSVFAERLHRESGLTVREARHGELLEPGTALVAPGDFHMRVRGQVVELSQDSPEQHCRPAVDVLFRSVAEVHGASALGVVLTGMGHDGLAGARAIRAAGGAIVVQDEASSAVWSMPGCIAHAGLADGVVSLHAMATEIARRVGRASIARGAGR
jgi:two-component system, chemotaxis family, protein-glutamate methylesterase/glutaminase